MNSNKSKKKRKPHQKKLARKGIKSLRGRPEYYEQRKKQYSLSLTPLAVEKLDAMAEERGLSRSEYVEQIARGVIS